MPRAEGQVLGAVLSPAFGDQNLVYELERKLYFSYRIVESGFFLPTHALFGSFSEEFQDVTAFSPGESRPTLSFWSV